MLYVLVLFFFNDTATTEIYTLSLHDALPISAKSPPYICNLLFIVINTKLSVACIINGEIPKAIIVNIILDRKSTRLNSSHANISYAVFCLKKKKQRHLHSKDHYQLNTLFC